MASFALMPGCSRRPVCAILNDRRGSTYAIIAAAMIPLIGFVGTGLDLGRTYMIASRLQSSVDNAALAAVRTEQLTPGVGNTLGPQTLAVVNQYLTANMPTSFMGATRTAPVVLVARSGDEVSVSISVTAAVPTTLMRVFSFESLPVKASATGVAGRSMPNAVEAMLVLDNTGSMRDNGGMVALRSSVNGFLDIVYGQSQSRQNFAIGMMPYNVIVNVGRLLPTSRVEQVAGYTDKPASAAHGWKGCILADPTIRTLNPDKNSIDADALDIGKNLPGDAGTPLAKPSIYPPMWVNSFHYQDNRYKLGATDADARSIANYEPLRAALVRSYGNGICVAGNSNNPLPCTEPGSRVSPSLLPDYSGWPEPVVYDPSPSAPASDAKNFVSKSPNYICPAEALPISYAYSKTQLKDYIDRRNMPLYNIGTWHNQAMTWGYRLLARDDVFTRARPANRALRRVLIFMTDGNYDSNDGGSTVTGRTPSAFMRDTAYTGYRAYADKLVVNQDWPSGDTGTGQARAAHRDALALRFAKTCQAMKGEGIEVYTITFAIAGGTEGDNTRELFRTCATNRNTHFFETKNAGDLRAAFNAIAADLVDLHLSR